MQPIWLTPNIAILSFFLTVSYALPYLYGVISNEKNSTVNQFITITFGIFV